MKSTSTTKRNGRRVWLSINTTGQKPRSGRPTGARSNNILSGSLPALSRLRSGATSSSSSNSPTSIPDDYDDDASSDEDEGWGRNNQELDDDEIDEDEELQPEDDTLAASGNIDDIPGRWYENNNSKVVQALKRFQKRVLDEDPIIMTALEKGDMWFKTAEGCPEVTYIDNWKHKRDDAGSPAPFYQKQVFVWSPHNTFPDVQFSCYHCSKKCSVSTSTVHREKTDIRPKGWTASPRKVYGREDVIYVFTRVYKCVKCNHKLYSYKPDFLNALPHFATRSFPFLFTYRAGIYLDLFQDFLSLMETSAGVAGFRKLLREKYMLRYTYHQLSFYSCLKHLRNKTGQLLLGEQRMNAERLQQIVKSNDISEFEDKSGYYGQIPSQKFLTGLIIFDSLERKYDYYRLEIQRRGGKILKVDDSFKVAKHFQRLGDAKLIDGLHTLPK